MLVASGVTVAGLATLALPTVAMAASDGSGNFVYPSSATQTNKNSDGTTTAGTAGSYTNTFSIAPGSTAVVALVGGGGAGGGQSNNQNGLPGSVTFVSIDNTGAAYVQLGFSLGGGGLRTSPYYGAGGAGVGNGQVNGGTPTEGSGGASSILYTDPVALTTTVLVVAAGGNSYNGAVGGNGTAGSPPSTLTITPLTVSGAPSNYVAPTSGGSTPGSGGADHGNGGYQGAIYVTG